MYYSPVIRFETSLVNMDEAKAFTKSNEPKKLNHKQQIRCQCGYIKHLRITSRGFPVGVSYRKAQNLALGMGLSQAEKKMYQKMQQQREGGGGGGWRQRRLGRAKNYMRGDQQ